MSNDNPTVGVNPLRVFHQNICGLKEKKVDELIRSVLLDQLHIMCLTEHHLNLNWIKLIWTDIDLLPHIVES
jgi:hypothetical protein